MECDMCGKPNALFVIRIEGTMINACSSCRDMGTFIRKIETEPLGRTFKQIDDTPEMIETVREETPKILRTYREKIGKTVEDFSQQLNIKASTYQHYESGSKLPDIETARKLERVIKQKLVVYLKMGKINLERDETEEMTLSHFIKKRKS